MAIALLADSFSDPNCRVLTVAGFVATEARWAQPASQWREALDAESVSALPMHEFAQSRGAIQYWNRDEPRRQRFIAVTTKVRENTQQSFFVGSRLGAVPLDGESINSMKPYGIRLRFLE